MHHSKPCHRDPVAQAVHYISLSADRPELTPKYINPVKGRGVFSQSYFEKGDFLVEYKGEIISFDECQRRKKIYHDALHVYLFEFKVNGKKYCIDAARDDNSFGRLVNDDHLNPNSQIKRITVKGKPHLCLFAIRQIQPGEEITYDYGDIDWPRREQSDDLALQSPDKAGVNAEHATMAECCKADLQDDAVAVETPNQGEDPSTVVVAQDVVVEFPQADRKDDAVETPNQGEDPSTVVVAHDAMVEFPEADRKRKFRMVESILDDEPEGLSMTGGSKGKVTETDLKTKRGTRLCKVRRPFMRKMWPDSHR